LFGSIAVWLGAVGLDKSRTGGFARVVIEKPFGSDEQSARELNAEISSVFAEDQVSASTTTGHGDGAEPAGRAVRERDLRTDLERPRGA